MTNLFLTVLNMSITAIFVILAVLVLRLLFKRLPRVYSYLLWIVVMLRLVCPFALEADFGVIPSVQVGSGTEAGTQQESMSNPTEKQSQAVSVEDMSVGENMGYDLSMEAAINNIPDTWYTEEAAESLNGLQSAPWRETAEPESGDIAGNKERSTQGYFDGELKIGQGISPVVWRILSAIWLTGMLLFIGYGVWSYRKLLLKLQKLPERPQRLDGQEETDVVISEHIETPFTAGFLKPMIYLPAGIAPIHQEMVMEHEKMHIRRRDYLIKAAAYFITCLHWFNPLVWLSFRLMEADMEASCDEAVLKRIGYDRKKTYAKALLSLSSGHPVEIGRCPLAFGENNVKERIKNAVGLKKVKTWIAVVSAILVVGVTVLLSVNHTGKNSVEYAADSTQEQTGENTADSVQEQTGEDTVEGSEELPNHGAAEDDTAKNMQEPASDTQSEIPSDETDDLCEVLLRNPEGNYNDVQILYSYPTADGVIAVAYGRRVHPLDGTVSIHSGMDFKADSGSDIYAAADGTVFETGYDTICGNYMILNHSNGDLTYYMHCSELLAEVGQKVMRGETIAKVGNTGASTGAHLHFAVSHGGGYIEPVFEMTQEEQIVRELYQDWKEYFANVWMNEPTYSEEHWKEGYAVVDSRVFQSIEDIKELTEEIFTADCANDHFYKKYLDGEAKVYFEQNGQLCRSSAMFTDGLSELQSVQITYASDSYIRAELSCYAQWADNGDGLEIIVIKVTKENGQWRISWYKDSNEFVDWKDYISEWVSVIPVMTEGFREDYVELQEGTYRGEDVIWATAKVEGVEYYYRFTELPESATGNTDMKIPPISIALTEWQCSVNGRAVRIGESEETLLASYPEYVKDDFSGEDHLSEGIEGFPVDDYPEGFCERFDYCLVVKLSQQISIGPVQGFSEVRCYDYAAFCIRDGKVAAVTMY